MKVCIKSAVSSEEDTAPLIRLHGPQVVGELEVAGVGLFVLVVPGTQSRLPHSSPAFSLDSSVFRSSPPLLLPCLLPSFALSGMEQLYF